MGGPWLFRLIRSDKSSDPLELHDLDSHPQYGDKAKCIGWDDGAATGFEASVSASNERRNVVYGPVLDALLPPFYLRYNIVRTLSGLGDGGVGIKWAWDSFQEPDSQWAPPGPCAFLEDSRWSIPWLANKPSVDGDMKWIKLAEWQGTVASTPLRFPTGGIAERQRVQRLRRQQGPTGVVMALSGRTGFLGITGF